MWCLAAFTRGILHVRITSCPSMAQMENSKRSFFHSFRILGDYHFTSYSRYVDISNATMKNTKKKFDEILRNILVDMAQLTLWQTTDPFRCKTSRENEIILKCSIHYLPLWLLSNFLHKVCYEIIVQKLAGFGCA